MRVKEVQARRARRTPHFVMTMKKGGQARMARPAVQCSAVAVVLDRLARDRPSSSRRARRAGSGVERVSSSRAGMSPARRVYQGVRLTRHPYRSKFSRQTRRLERQSRSAPQLRKPWKLEKCEAQERRESRGACAGRSGCRPRTAAHRVTSVSARELERARRLIAAIALSVLYWKSV